MGKLKWVVGLLKTFWSSSQIAKGIIIVAAVATIGGTTAAVVPKVLTSNEVEMVSEEVIVEEINTEEVENSVEEMPSTENDLDMVNEEGYSDEASDKDNKDLVSKKKLKVKEDVEESTEEAVMEEKVEKLNNNSHKTNTDSNTGSVNGGNANADNSGNTGNSGNADSGNAGNSGNADNSGNAGNSGNADNSGNTGNDVDNENGGSSDNNTNEDNNGNNDDSSNNEDTDDGKPETPDEETAYKLIWSDEFNGTELNRDDWNVELHEPGWVNAELQKYVDSEENIYIKDGKLVLRPVETVNEDGTKSYTSGRVNTQNKHNFTYGKFEVSARVPEGKGYLPAFWLMAADENVYGQWPRCGEIDIMEVLGSATDTLHGTIHYGHNSTTGHKQSQGTYKLDAGSFADEFHTFSCEWEPGKITWYVDGIKYYEENDWYTAMADGSGELTYPAPFDQPFYIILNLAVGGSWVGYPDETTDFANQTYEIDYVRVYQKESYDENVTKPETEDVVVRDPDANGNYLINGDFETVEDLVEADNWQFKTASNGVGKASITKGISGINAIAGNSAIIETTNAGDVDYSIQLLQNNVPLKAGATYELSFDAYATADRNMKVNSKAPDNGWHAYLDKTVALTTQKQTYTYEFEMIHKDDVNCTVEFNMGNFASTDTIVIDNVSLKIKSMNEDLRDSIVNPVKSVRADGNYIYNGEFVEGNRHLGYWDVSNAADVSVTSLEDGRRLKVVVPANGSVTLTQTNVPVASNVDYAMSLDAEVPGTGSIQIAFDGASYTVAAGTNGSWEQKFTTSGKSDKRDITLTFNGEGTYYLDNIRIDENALIKNGSFNAGFSGYEPYVYAGDMASYNVDSMTYDNAAAFDINTTGNQAWYIQLKQNGIELENGQWYKLSLDAKSTVDRKLMFAIQRDGSKHNDDWTPYSGEEKVNLTNDWQTFALEFQMTEPTDLESVLSISMGAVDGIVVDGKHSVYIDNIALEKIAEPEMEDVIEGENMLLNPKFANDGEHWNKSITSPAVGTISTGDGSITYALTNVGTEDWHVQLIQMGLPLQKGQTYNVSFKAQSTEARTIKANVMSASYAWYGGKGIELEKDTVADVSFDVTMNVTDKNGGLYLSLGQIYDDSTKEAIDTPASTITLSDFRIIKVGGDTGVEETPEEPKEDQTEIIKNGNFENGVENWSANITADAVATADASTGKMVFSISNVGTANYHLQLAQSNMKLEQGTDYNVSFTIKSSIARQIKWALMEDGNITGDWTKWYGGSVESLDADVEKTVTATVTPSSASEYGIFQITMSPDGDMALEDLVGKTVDHTIEIDNVSITKAGNGSESLETFLMKMEEEVELVEEETETTEEETETTEEITVEETETTEETTVEETEAIEETTVEETETTEETTVEETEAIEETTVEETEATEETTVEENEAIEETTVEETEVREETTEETETIEETNTTEEQVVEESESTENQTEENEEISTVDFVVTNTEEEGKSVENIVE